MQENKKQLDEENLKGQEKRDNMIGIALVGIVLYSIYGLFIRPFI